MPRDILCLKVRESRTLYIYICIFHVVISHVLFFCCFCARSHRIQIFSKISIWPINWILTGTITPVQIGPESIENEVVLRTPKIFRTYLMAWLGIAHYTQVILSIFYNQYSYARRFCFILLFVNIASFDY